MLLSSFYIQIFSSVLYLQKTFFLFIYWAGAEPSPLLMRPLIGLLHLPWMIYGDDCGAFYGMND
jgi:hypothetical protein